MTSSIQNMKVILEITDHSQDALLTLYLNRAINFVKDYCNISEIPLSLADTCEDIAIIRYRLHGAEGLMSESKGSLSEKFINHLPNNIINQLNAHKRVKFLWDFLKKYTFMIG